MAFNTPQQSTRRTWRLTQHNCFSALRSYTGTGDIALLAACVSKKPLMRHILCVYSVSEGQKKFFGIPEADTEYWRSVTLFEDSNVPKTDVVASVIAAETLLPTFHAADLNSLRAYLHSPGAATWIQPATVFISLEVCCYPYQCTGR